MGNKRRKIVESPSEKLTEEDKKKIRDFLRSQARIIIDCFEQNKVDEKV